METVITEPEFFAPWAVDALNADEATTNAAQVLALVRAGAYGEETQATRSHLDELTEAIARATGEPVEMVRVRALVRANRLNREPLTTARALQVVTAIRRELGDIEATLRCHHVPLTDGERDEMARRIDALPPLVEGLRAWQPRRI